MAKDKTLEANYIIKSNEYTLRCFKRWETILAIHSQLFNWLFKFSAWHLYDPDAEKVFKTLRNAGAKLVVASNFHTRLRPVLQALNCDYWFDIVAVSGEAIFGFPLERGK
ncbi:hypothetical protein HYC85_025545 [Camellia sinensis]|uniref:Uncharacterized protein n=1 Tax=Camellia sinensis TaxID=4442 RepID=A0A7J7GBB5_CAMSI|nr:hypothetical protein HYC85_025545 [Camellia sinensis]